MTANRKILIVPFIIVLFWGSIQNLKGQCNCTPIDTIVRGEYLVKTQNKNIPKVVKKYLHSITDDFKVKCFGNSLGGNRKLNFIIKYNNEYLIVYSRNGRYRTTHLLQIVLKNQKVCMFQHYILNGNSFSFETFRESSLSGKLFLTYPEEINNL